MLVYYRARTNLRRYTIESEIPRAHYSVITSTGSFESRLPQLQELARAAAPGSKEDLMWRVANQSCFAEVLLQLHAHLAQPNQDMVRLQCTTAQQ